MDETSICVDALLLPLRGWRCRCGTCRQGRHTSINSDGSYDAITSYATRTHWQDRTDAFNELMSAAHWSRKRAAVLAQAAAEDSRSETIPNREYYPTLVKAAAVQAGLDEDDAETVELVHTLHQSGLTLAQACKARSLITWEDSQSSSNAAAGVAEDMPRDASVSATPVDAANRIPTLEEAGVAERTWENSKTRQEAAVERYTSLAGSWEGEWTLWTIKADTMKTAAAVAAELGWWLHSWTYEQSFDADIHINQNRPLPTVKTDSEDGQ